MNFGRITEENQLRSEQFNNKVTPMRQMQEAQVWKYV